MSRYVALILFGLTACTSWQEVDLSPCQIRAEFPDQPVVSFGGLALADRTLRLETALRPGTANRSALDGGLMGVLCVEAPADESTERTQRALRQHLVEQLRATPIDESEGTNGDRFSLRVGDVTYDAKMLVHGRTVAVAFSGRGVRGVSRHERFLSGVRSTQP